MDDPGNAAVKVCRSRLPSRANRAAITDESMPLLRNTPTGRSATVRMATAASSVSSQSALRGCGAQ